MILIFLSVHRSLISRVSGSLYERQSEQVESDTEQDHGYEPSTAIFYQEVKEAMEACNETKDKESLFIRWSDVKAYLEIKQPGYMDWTPKKLRRKFKEAKAQIRKAEIQKKSVFQPATHTFYTAVKEAMAACNQGASDNKYYIFTWKEVKQFMEKNEPRYEEWSEAKIRDRFKYIKSLCKQQ